MESTFETIVVGGGLVGAAVAMGIASKGHSVAVLDGMAGDGRAACIVESAAVALGESRSSGRDDDCFTHVLGLPWFEWAASLPESTPPWHTS